MTRKDSEKDSERAHYYSQFWLDIAAGRRTIGGPRPNEEGEALEPEIAEPAPIRRAGRSTEHEPGDRYTASEERAERVVHPVAEPIEAFEGLEEPEEEELELPLGEVEPEEYQDTPVEDTDIPDMDLSPAEEEEEEEFFEEEEEEEEEEDDASWARGRKKPKPSRPVKQPPVKKPGKRDTRRGY